MRTVSLVVAMLLAGCTGHTISPEVVEGQVYHVPSFEWRVVSEADLRTIYIGAGESLSSKEKLEGFVGKEGETFVVYTTAPIKVDDQAVLTLGHEVLHLAVGDYHK